MRRLLPYIILLLCSPSLLAQSGVGYVNYKSYKTHYGNGSSSTLNGVTYSGISDNIAELEAVLDVNQPGTTLTHEGEAPVNSSYGFIGGRPPHWYSEYYAVHHWGWLQAQETGTYRFKLTSDDASALWVDEELVLFRPCCGSSYVNVSMVEGQWYRIDTKWQEYTGGDNMTLLYSPPSSSSYFNVGVNSSHLIFTNGDRTPFHTLAITYNIHSNLDKTEFRSSISKPDLGTNDFKYLDSNGQSEDSQSGGLITTLYNTENYKSTTIGGSTEWCVVYSYDATNRRYRVGIDKREFASGFDFTKLTHLQLFDLWDGSVTYKSDDSAWAEYYIYTDTELDFTNSTSSSYIRNGNGYYALKAEFSFEQIMGYTPHRLYLAVVAQYFTNTIKPDLITIADVVKGFSQLTNQTDTPEGLGGGIFTSDIEFILGDVNNDDKFDFRDTQLMLEHIMGEVSPFDDYLVSDFVKTFESNYTNSVTVDWVSKKEERLYPHTLDDDNPNQTREFNVAFLGDLNFSHSYPLQQVEVSAKTSPQIMLSKSGTDNVMILDVVKENDILKVTLEIPQNQNNITGTQFKVYYDESRLEFQDSDYSSAISSFTSKRNGYINIGSFSADGSLNLNNGMSYTLNFKLTSELKSTLGLISLGFSELVDKDGNKVDYTIR